MSAEVSTITVSLEKEKMEALTLYLGKTNTTPTAEMQGALRELYESTVPDSVRGYIADILAHKPT